MTTFTKIPEADAPPKIKTPNERKQYEFERYLLTLGEGEVGMFELASGESTRGVRMTVAAAERRLIKRGALPKGKKLEAWTLDNAVYCRLIDEAPAST